ncbi:MAG: four-carbon acid sugar kinase family protein [candidate division NC10 bacterium]|nr:four-carbon acid sugar kinase family protein [candidate division NC10 bacterium]
MSVRLGVVADDLTGANAVGAQLAEVGLPSVATADPAALATVPADLAAAVLDVDSRADGPAGAAEKVRAAVAALRDWGAGIFYKKTDSTLRGNLGAELDAFREATGAPALPFLPASPLNARLTVDGVLLVEGRPLAETPIARRAIPPVAHSAVAAVLGEQSRAPVASIPLAAIRGPDAVLRAALREAAARAQVLVCDAATVGDVAAVAAACVKEGFAGAAAGGVEFCGALARHLLPCAGSPILLVVGSLEEVSDRQVARLLEDSGTLPFVAEPAALLKTAGRAAAETAVVALASRAAAEGRNLLIRTRPDLDAAEAAFRRGREAGLGAEKTRRAIADGLGRLAVAAASVPLGGLVLVGGDTTAGVYRAFGATGTVIEGALAPSVPIGRLCGGRFAGLPVITKPGGWGEEAVLLAAVRALRRVRPESVSSP